MGMPKTSLVKECFFLLKTLSVFTLFSGLILCSALMAEDEDKKPSNQNKKPNIVFIMTDDVVGETWVAMGVAKTADA